MRSSFSEVGHKSHDLVFDVAGGRVSILLAFAAFGTVVVSFSEPEEVEQAGPQALARKYFVPGGAQVPDRVDTLIHRAVPVVEDDYELQKHGRQVVVTGLRNYRPIVAGSFDARELLPHEQDNQGENQLNVREVMLDKEA